MNRTTTPIRSAPPEPQSIADTGCSLGFLSDLALKTIYYGGELSAQELCDRMRLPFVSVMETVLDFLKREELAVISGGGGYTEQGLQYVVTSKGAERSREALLRSQYVGPAPVGLDEYRTLVRAQSVANLSIGPEQVRDALNHLVLGPGILDALGPAVNSGRAIFIYGAPGSGKSTIAEAIQALLGGDIFVPYAVDAAGHIIRVHDPQTHGGVEKPPATGAEGEAVSTTRGDARWVRCRRPFVQVGGELTLGALDLNYDDVMKYYEAPLQMRANGGMLFIDDFGRQLVRPADLLNRWMVPLEKRVDYLTLHTGQKVQIPFDELVVFSTNIEPRQLVDEAFLRRIRHKVEAVGPTVEEFRLITQRVCDERGVAFDEAVFDYLVQEHYMDAEREMRGVHPRDLMDQVIDICKYRGIAPAMTEDLIDDACRSYFVRV